MGLLSVIAATVGAYALGAVYYMALSRRWLAATGLPLGPDGRPVGGTMWPMAIGFVCTLMVVGMMRHVFVMSALDTPAEGLMGGFGIGAFLVTPWLVMCYAYSMRSRALMIIDGAYAVIGATVAGLILTLF